ncbi:MAG: AarF/UbiB family protein [Aeromonas sp.]
MYYGDLHTGNILVNKKTLQVKVIDFGLSLRIDQSFDRKLSFCFYSICSM